jgi:hypothetical protein
VAAHLAVEHGAGADARYARAAQRQGVRRSQPTDLFEDVPPFGLCAALMAETPIATGSAPDTWLKEALNRLLAEGLLFGQTFIAFLLRPRRSVRQWKAGERLFMNPLAFSATAAAVYWSVTSVVAGLWPVPESGVPSPLLQQFSSAVTPYVHYGVLGTAMHIGLRCLGSPRRVFGSIGAALFTGGSIGKVAALLLNAIAQLIGHARGTGAFEVRSGDPIASVLLLAAVLSYVAVCVTMLRAMMALHLAPRWKVVLAGGFAVVLTAFVLGSMLPEGEYGWHPYIIVDVGPRFALSFGFRS